MLIKVAKILNYVAVLVLGEAGMKLKMTLTN